MQREATEFAAALDGWFRANARALPWRTARREFYPTWISEVMLQQTRVETVVPRFERWMKRFPDVASVAAASEDEILKEWEGLGYYSRARNLHRAARIIVARGREPSSSAELDGLPGFGPYTRGAVASLAFDEAAPAVDGNVKRV
ncbi:MAG: HhH-GPD family protein, partial [Thermoplasmatota archaeon]